MDDCCAAALQGAQQCVVTLHPHTQGLRLHSHAQGLPMPLVPMQLHTQGKLVQPHAQGMFMPAAAMHLDPVLQSWASSWARHLTYGTSVILWVFACPGPKAEHFLASRLAQIKPVPQSWASSWPGTSRRITDLPWVGACPGAQGPKG